MRSAMKAFASLQLRPPGQSRPNYSHDHDQDERSDALADLGALGVGHLVGREAMSG